MKLHILGSGAGIPSKERHTQCIILDCIEEVNGYYCIDACEGMQHQLLHTNIKPGKIQHMFITHLHGDHIYGLPGFLSSRDHLGGRGIPLTIYGPKGLAAWIEMTLELSNSHLSYPLEIIEVAPYDTFEMNHMTITVIPMIHNIECYGYIFKEDDRVGELRVDKLQAIGLEPGPLYREIKTSDTFTHDDKTYQTADFLGPIKRGRKVVIHGDTEVINDARYKELIDNADLIAHESTYLDGEQEKAHHHHHSEISDVLSNLEDINYKQLLITHISNRYDYDQLQELQEKHQDDCVFAYDFQTVTIPRNPE